MDDPIFKVAGGSFQFSTWEKEKGHQMFCLKGKLKAQLIQVLPFMDLSQVGDAKRALRLKTNDSH